jgi:hypothetical protein
MARHENKPSWSYPTCYVPASPDAIISIFPSGNKTTDRGRGRSLICYTLRWALALNRQYDIKNWYAIAATEEGKHLLEGLGFTAIEGTREGYHLEDLEVAMPVVKDILKKMGNEEQWSLPIPIIDEKKKGSSRKDGQK